MNFEFDKWAGGVGFPTTMWENHSYKDVRTAAALSGWNGRQPEIDALMAEIEQLKIEVVAMSFRDQEWADAIKAAEETDALKAENKRLRRLLKETRYHIMDWWTYGGRGPNALPPDPVSYDLVERIDAYLKEKK